jgi:PAS domain S-box-containing protein
MNSTSLYRANTVNHVFDSVIITDKDGIITDWNTASEELFGHSSASAIGQPISLIHVPEDSETVTLAVISAIAKDGFWHGKVRSYHQDGSIGKVESKCIAIYDENKEVIGTIGSNSKMTDDCE